MALSLSNEAARILAETGLRDIFNGETAGTVRLQIHDAAPAAAAVDGRSEVANAAWPTTSLLAELVLNPGSTTPFAAAALGGTPTRMRTMLGVDPTDDAAADKSGTATHFLIYVSGETAPTAALGSGSTAKRLSGTVGTSNADMLIDNAGIILNGQVNLASGAWGIAL